MQDSPFIDYYQLLQVSPTAELETIQRVFRLLASRYHPENPHTGDAGRFQRLTRAYEILSKRETRAAYDVAHQLHVALPLKVFELREFAPGIDGERNRRMGILCILFNRRRSNLEAPGLSILDLENQTGFPREHLQFTLWCLKESELIRQNETTDFAITGQGVDYLEKNLPSNQILYEMMKATEMGDSDRLKVDDLAAHNTA
jgi:curved DNA-binding protein CbpA